MPITPDQFQEMQRRLMPKTRFPVPDDAVEEEIPLHHEIIKWCKDQFPRVPYVHSRTDKRSRTKKGTPDFIIGYRGKTYWIECKDRDGKRSTDQLTFTLLLELQGLKDVYGICRSFTEFLSIISTHQ